MKYDFVVVGAGLYGATFTYEALKRNRHLKILVVDKRNHIGGNCYTENIQGIQVHMYGAHIFRTNNRCLWNELCDLTEMQTFINSPIARVNDKLYNLPFNMNTFYQLFGATTPQEAMKCIQDTIPKDIVEPKNLEEWVLSQLGTTIYETLIKGYTEKQWGKECKDLPISIMKRLPIRDTFNNNYYNAEYQGVALNYTNLIERMLKGADVCLGDDGKKYLDMAERKVIYTGAVDELFDYSEGNLEYRSVKFVHKVFNSTNIQGNAVINYPSIDVPYTRSIEHRHFYNYCPSDKTVVSYEYPSSDGEKSYPIEDDANRILYNVYFSKVMKEFPRIILAGRLGEYRYYDMEETITNAKTLVNKLKLI